MVNHSRGLVEMFAAVHAIWLPQRIGSWWMTSFHGDMRSYQSGDYEHVCNDLAPHLQSNHPHTVHCWRSIFNWQNLKHPCRAIVKHSQIDHQHTSEIPTIANYGWFIVVYGIALLTFTNIEFKSYGWLKNLLNSTLLNLTKHLYYILLYILYYICTHLLVYTTLHQTFTKHGPQIRHRFTAILNSAFSLPKYHQELPETAEANLFLRILGWDKQSPTSVAVCWMQKSSRTDGFHWKFMGYEICRCLYVYVYM